MYTREEYEAKRQARYERLKAAAEKAEHESSATLDQARQMASVIPFGQPILIGHHSERRDRNYRERIHNKHRKGYELAKKAEEYKSRAESAENNTNIYSDNPDAAELLTDKAETLKAEQAEMKRINAALRKGANFHTLEMSEEHRDQLLVIDRVQGYYNPLKRGFPPYVLTNLNAKIKAAEKRAEQIKKQQAEEDTEHTTAAGVRIQYTPTENRIRIYFPGKPDEATRAELKRHGYRWAPSFGAWSAFYNWNAKIYANNLKGD